MFYHLSYNEVVNILSLEVEEAARRSTNDAIARNEQIFRELG